MDQFLVAQGSPRVSCQSMFWPKKFSILFQRVLLLMGLYFVLRVLFLIWNWPLYTDESLTALVQSFLRGFRYDLSAIVTVNAPFILLAVFLPQRWLFSSLYRKIQWPLFYVVNLFALGTSVADLEYYQFTGRRISLDVFSIGQDIKDQSLSMLLYYWPLSLIYLALALALWRFSPPLKDQGRRHRRPGLLSQSFWGFVVLVLAIIAGRGGLQLKPLLPVDAYTQASLELGSLTLNSAFTLTRSSLGDPAKIPSYFDNSEELTKALPLKALPPPTGQLKGYNVVVLILESFSLEYMGLPNNKKGYTPFLDSLVQEGHFFPNAFANGRRSIEALPSILCSLPALMDQPLITSNFQGNRYQCLGQVLKEAGYSRAFFHGAQNGSMFFDSFSSRAGFDQYFGLNEYPNPSTDGDGKWGIYDDAFFTFAVEQMTALPEPFASVLFSLSSHHPYSIPEEFKNRFPKGTLEIHESIAYTDHALEQFFQAAKQKPWFNKTLFVITADHTSLSDDPNYQNLRGPYRVPLLFWTPNNELKAQSSPQLAQHIDIFPSLTDLLGLKPDNQHLWGRPLFNAELSSETGIAFNKTAKGYWLIKDHNFVLISPQGELLETRVLSDPIIPIGSTEDHPTTSAGSTQAQKLQAQLKALIQYYFTGLIENKWPEKDSEETPQVL